MICPNEWANRSINEGLWIPGDPCERGDVYTINGTKYGSDETGCIGTPGECHCVQYDKEGKCLRCIDPHGNPQFLAALQDFVRVGQAYERGTCPDLQLNRWEVAFYDQYRGLFDFFSNDDGLYIMLGFWGIFLLYWLGSAIYVGVARRKSHLH